MVSLGARSVRSLIYPQVGTTYIALRVNLPALASHPLSARNPRSPSWALLYCRGYGDTHEGRAERERLWTVPEALHKRVKPVMLRISRTPAETSAGIYAKALIVRGSVTGAAGLARTLAADLIACSELRQSLWPHEPEPAA